METYENKYNEALEQAEKELATCGSMDCDAARLIFRLFPQLCESEDERIRKEIIAFIEWSLERGSITTEQRIASQSWFDYLERQKEHVPENEESGTRKEPKPAWGEEDEKMFWSVINGLRSGIYDAEREWLANRLKYLRPQPSWKPSEEQMRVLLDAINPYHLLGDGSREILKSIYEQLKKL